MRAIVHSMPPQSSSEAGSSSICPLFATSKSCAVAAGSYTALLTRLRLSIYQGESAFEQRWGRSRPQVRIYMIDRRSEEHTSELQSLMRISYAVFCLKKKNKHNTPP